MNLTLLALAAALLLSEVASLVRFWRRCGRVERQLAASWEATLRHIDDADRRRRSLN